MNQSSKIKNNKFNDLLKKSRNINIMLERELKNIEEDTILYINYPFCQNFCNFCIYKVHCYDQNNSNEFLKYYNKEILLYAKILKGFKFKNIHIGGGTPNLVSPESLIKPLMKLVNFNNLERFIIEIFPCDNFESYLKKLKKYNVTKVQLGVQTLNEKILKQENRKVSKKTILNCLKILSKSDLIWSVDLIYGFENESYYCNNRIAELKDILTFRPHGVHFYKLRAQETNDYYGKANYGYSIYEKKIDLSYFENILIKEGYKKVYDEWCLEKNIEHSQITVCYNGYSKAFPDILGLGLMAKSHFRFGLAINFKDLKIYKHLLNMNVIPIRTFHNFKKTNIYPIFNIYTGIKRLSKFNLGSFLDNAFLTKTEKNELNTFFDFLRNNRIEYKYKDKNLTIPKSQFSRCLYLLEKYMKSAYSFKNK